ncbi:N-(5'-phosphoribosyl)anthranilate isomerase [Hartmannibacter diazotrophicus]|uniref:N-(5'-phosphoribosyl)anthranilate isomerase n=1 Tax=Hartmannibacter diazotrophicus TaxID=1482074 RepID=A0A2C9CZT8_9HYPH|nr:phosphoribosylanthranilate isomerase [Hartmannibacter diazotrophicus]SON53602.1 N-(5'-phosphoribosyl)anthranilate isomerase [Hartmannibacter diazotrophicus]
MPGAAPALCVKICGLSTTESLDWAVAAGADLIGLVSFEKSPRHVDLDRMAMLADHVRGRAGIVVLTVNADDERLARIAEAARPDLLQLHGKETVERASEISGRFGIPVMKALGIATREDVATARPYAEAGHRLLFDAKPPKDATRPGGLGATFDWSVLESLDPDLRFMLSGGLDPNNVGEAVNRLHPAGVDVSSGVESAPGTKDKGLIEAFVHKVREAAGRPLSAAHSRELLA